jgi:AraC-like DNA-binding protein
MDLAGRCALPGPARPCGKAAHNLRRDLPQLKAARRILLGENLESASAGYRVGYEDVSQFSREYRRLFGQPPMRDVERLRAAAR